VFKAFRFAMKYRALLPVMIEFITFIQTATADSKLNKQERARALSLFWKMIKEAQQVNQTK
jgi:hypothetical protein